MKYRTEVDGLRALAVLPVILFHGGVGIFSGGYVGVDVFFVISGYLITAIIVTKIEDSSFSLLDFYSRRARRILPALALVMICSIPFAWMLMLPSDFRDFAQSIAAVSLFSSNFLFWLENDYFATSAELKPLLHTWSLAVEEQYYIVFPLLMIAFWGWSRRFSVLLLCVIFCISLAASQMLSSTHPEANFYLLPSRAWELLAGSLCAIWVLRTPPAAHEPLAFCGLTLLVASIFLYDATTPFPSLYALVPVLGTCLILLFATQGTLVARLLSMRVLVGVGLVSYSAYLWHQPLFAFARIRYGHEPGFLLMLSLVGVSLILAYLSWRFVEQPVRCGSLPIWNSLMAAGAGSAVFLAMGLVLWQSDLQQRYFLDTISPQNEMLLANINRVAALDHYVTEDAGACRFYIDDFSRENEVRFANCAEQYGQAVVLFGDSHAFGAYKALIKNWDRPFMVGLSQQDCRPHVMGSDCETSALPLFLDMHAERIALAIYAQAGFWLLTDAQGIQQARRLFTDGSDLDPRLDEPAIVRVQAFLTRLGAELPVIWLGPRLEPHISMNEMLNVPCDTASDRLGLRPRHIEVFERLDKRLITVAREAGVGYASLQEIIDFDIRTDLFTCDSLYWSDGDHWSPAGEQLFGARLLPAIQSMMVQN